MELVLMAFLLVGSAFFSACETALFSIPRYQLRRLTQKPGIAGRSVAVLLESQRSLLVTVLLGNMFVNVLYSSLAVLYGARLALEHGYHIFVLVDLAALALLIIIGEVVPKSVAVNMPLTIAKFFSPPLLLFRIVVTPLRVFFEGLVKFITKIIIGGRKDALPTPEDFANLLEIGTEHGLLTPWEKRILGEVMEFGGIEVREVMTPRIKVALSNIDCSREEIVELMYTSKHSKIPVWRETRDNITGVIHSKDVFLYPEKPLEELVRPVVFSPETAKIDYILHDMLSKQRTIVMVVDEYGGLEGIVTLEDIVEEIVGEIEDEFDKSSSKVTLLSDGRYMISAGLTLREWNDIAGTSFADEKVETLGGIVAMKLDRLPRKGDFVELQGFRFTVLRVIEEHPKVLIAQKLRGAKRRKKETK
jgi:putative hemolysin